MSNLANMAESQDDDPFDWDVDRVVRELCSSNRSWLPAPRAQLPDSDQLASKIRDAGYDGQVLLISLDDEADLWFDLSITATKFKQSIRTAIRQFRSRSQKFKAYDQSLREGIVFNSNTNKQPVLSLGLPDASNNQPVSSHAKASDHLLNGTRGFEEQGDTDEPPKKKPRRLGTQDLVAVERPTGSTVLRTIPTEADTVTLFNKDEQSATTNSDMGPMNGHRSYNSSLEKLFSKPGAFWGEGKMSSADILELDPETSDGFQDLSWTQPWPLGSGRKAHVNCRMKRYLGRHSRLETVEDLNEDVLPVYGESAEDYFDPDQDAIDREIAEEEEEVRREKASLQKSEMQPDAVDACLTQMCDEYTTHWRETKLPILQRKAYGMWTKARKRGNRYSQIHEFSNALRVLQKRLDAVLNGLKENVYSRETELRRLGPVLEPPIYEIEKTKWSIRVLTGTAAPEKISLPRTADPVPKKAMFEQDDDGMDIWSEEEMDGLNDFIVDDSSSFHSQEADEVTTDLVMNVRTKAPPVSDIGQSFTSTSDDIVIHDLTGPGNDLLELHSMEPRLKADHSGAQVQISDIQDIVNKGTEYWEQVRDGPRLVLTMIHNWSAQRQEKIFRPVNNSDNPEQIWNESIEPAINSQSDPPASTPEDSKGRARLENAIRLAKLFDIYTGSKLTTSDKFKKLDEETVIRIGQRKSDFDRFWHFLRTIAPWFLEKHDDSEVEAVFTHDDDLNLTPAQKKKRRQANASRIQKHDTLDSQAQQARRALLRQKLQGSTLISGEKKRLIINESKLEGQGLVFVHENIASQIKDHQIDGVRFMWDQITRGTGCLLAHMMGLGKTMQVITLLTAIADAAKSEDETISVQIPEHLRQLKTLILCPPGILNNWIDELYFWAPEGVLGNIRYIDSNTGSDMRQKITQDWAVSGGVLVIGYNLLSGMKGKSDDLLDLILETPSLVVGDEAHYLKNASSKRGEIATRFRTRSRIALTGSPLANNVDEFYSTIDWVAPGFLGKKEDFSSKYATPIKEGLWKASHVQERRMARISLEALKKVVFPKVHRRTVGVLKESLPPKKEFILYLDLVAVQKKAYQAYMLGIKDTMGEINVQTVWGMTSTLRELLAHPSIFHQKLRENSEVRGRLTSKASHLPDKDDDFKGPAHVVDSTLEVLGPERFFDTISASYKMLVLDKILEEAMKLGENVLVFSHSLRTLNYIESNLCRLKQRAFKRLDGSTHSSLRQGIVKEFNRNKSQAFLIATTAGGVGLNIYGANRVVILDFQYNPVNEQQAIGRAYRIGQTKEVLVYWLICDGTFEKNLHQHQVFKTQLASRVVDKKHPLPKADRELLDWFKDCQEVPHKDKSGHRGKDVVLDALLDTQAICDGISSIDTTETFEEEEEDKVLSANDQIAADRLAAEQSEQGNVAAATQIAQNIPFGQHSSDQVQQPLPIPASDSVDPFSLPNEGPVSPPEERSVVLHQAMKRAGQDNGVLDAPELNSSPLGVMTTTHHKSDTVADSSTQIPHSGQPSCNVSLGPSRSMPSPSPLSSTPNAQYQAHPTIAQPLSDTQPQIVGPVKCPSPDPSNSQVRGRADIEFPNQPLPSQHGFPGQVWSGTNMSHQPFQQHSPSPPVGLDGHRHQPSGPVVPMGLNSTILEQHSKSTPVHNAPQPIMLNAQQRPSVKPPNTLEQARDRLKRKLVELNPLAAGKVDRVLQDLDRLRVGGLQKQKMLDDIFNIIRHDSDCAAALVDGRISAQALTKAGTTTRDKLKELLLGMSRERDPDV